MGLDEIHGNVKIAPFARFLRYLRSFLDTSRSGIILILSML